jgi:hypothetical protein
MSQPPNTLGPHPVGSTTSMQNLASTKSDDKVDFFKFDEAAVHNLIDFEASVSAKDFFKLFNQEEFHEYIKSIYTMKQKVSFFCSRSFWRVSRSCFYFLAQQIWFLIKKNV